MVPNFEIDLIMNGRRKILQIVELDLIPNSDGYVRYQITLDKMITSVAFDSRYWIAPVLLTAEDVESYYERIHYPDVPKFQVIGNNLTADQIEQIRLSIVAYKVETSN